MIKVERQKQDTKLKLSGSEVDLKYEILTFLEFLEEYLPGWDLRSLKEDAGKIDFDKGDNENDF